MAHFLRIALGSLAEVDSQLELARRLDFGGPDPEIQLLIVGLRAKTLRLHDKIAGVRR